MYYKDVSLFIRNYLVCNGICTSGKFGKELFFSRSYAGLAFLELERVKDLSPVDMSNGR